MPAISIIMPCYNRAHDLQRVLEAYDHQQHQPDFELIAVDDCSPDETLQVLSNFRPAHYHLRVERQEKNKGPASARNKAIPLARSPLTAFVGDDILPGSNFVIGHIDAHRHFPKNETAILGKVEWPDDFLCNTLMKHIDGAGAEQFSYFYMLDGQEYDFRHLYTANISLKTAFLRSVDHWFDTDFVYAAFEDVELSYRLAQRGLQIVYQSAIAAKHYHYHNIWTFSDRQFKSGKMAVVLAWKHSRLSYLIRTPIKQLLALAFRPGVLFRKHTLEQVLWVESLAYRLASFYEWDGNPLLDNFYAELLRYAYFSGVLQGVFDKSKFGPRARDLYCTNYLIPVLLNYVDQAVKTDVPLPEFFTQGEIQALAHMLKK